mmetsp:Transcript_6980/g.21191  ORF Transcript_6980/g.21191 Transcript_6980/m.21191 type:complete len:313 (-) Transcript_6980:434-1372(-)
MRDEHAQHQRTVDGLLACQCRGPPARGRHSCLLRHARAEVRARTQGAHRERQVQEGACPAPGGHTERPRAPFEPPPHFGSRNRAPHLCRRRPRLARTGVPQVDRRFLPRPQLALHALLLVQTQGPPHGEGHLPPRGGRLVGGQGHRDHGQVHAEHTIPRRRTSLCRGDPRGAERHPCQVARGVPSVLAEQEQGGALRARVVPRHQQQDRGCALQAWPPATVRLPGLGSVPRLRRQGALHLAVATCSAWASTSRTSRRSRTAIARSPSCCPMAAAASAWCCARCWAGPSRWRATSSTRRQCTTSATSAPSATS